jgi:hypothetical protein
LNFLTESVNDSEGILDRIPLPASSGFSFPFKESGIDNEGVLRESTFGIETESVAVCILDETLCTFCLAF